MRKGSNLPVKHGARRPWGARLATEEGSSRHSFPARPRRGGVPSLLASRPTHAFSRCLTHPRRNRRWTRGAASHAASRGAVTFVAPPSGGLVPNSRRRRRCGCGSLPAFSRKREGYRTPGASKEAHGKRGPTHRHGLVLGERAPRSKRARIGRSRSCSRVMDVVAEVDGQWPAQRSGRTSISPDLEAFRDGRLARSSNVRKYAAAGEETLAPSSKRKPHVTVLESGCDPRMCAGGRRWKASWIVVVGGSSRNARKHGLGGFGGHRASRKRGESAGDATGVSEVRWSRELAEENAARPTREPPAEADRASVNRQVPQPPSSWVQARGGGARRKPRRDAGNACGASARSRKQVGSRSRSNASGSCSAYCRKAGRRRASQPVANCQSR